MFSVLFIWYSRNTGHSFFVYWAPFLLAGGALLLGIPVYRHQQRHDDRARRGPAVSAGAVMTTVTVPALGASSEVGTLRTVMVHRPDLAHERLSPSNCHELLFDDVIWVRRARQEFDAFVDVMRERGVEVLLVHDLLTETLRGP